MEIKNEFKFVDNLGQGCFSKVKKAIHIKTGEFVAIKIIKKSPKNPMEDIIKEIEIHKVLKHPNIVMLYNIYEDDKYVYLVQELAENGNLHDYIKRNNISIDKGLKIFYQIIDAMEYIHKKKIAHRDIKPHNILFDDKYNIKIADFGLSNFYVNKNRLSTPCGSAYYVAPNVITGQPYEPMSADIWSCGIILYKIWTGDLPFNSKINCKQDLFKKIIKGDFIIPNYLNKDLKQLISNILVVNPNRRIKFKEIKDNEIFNNLKNKLEVNRINKKNKALILEKITYKLEKLSINKENLKIDLEKNTWNNITMIYKILYNYYFKVLNKNMSKIKKNDHYSVEISKKKVIENKVQNKELVVNYNKILNEYPKKKAIKININKDNKNLKELLKNKNNKWKKFTINKKKSIQTIMNKNSSIISNKTNENSKYKKITKKITNNKLVLIKNSFDNKNVSLNKKSSKNIKLSLINKNNIFDKKKTNLQFFNKKKKFYNISLLNNFNNLNNYYK